MAAPGLHPHQLRHDLPDPFRGRFDLPVAEMGVSERHAHVGMAEQAGTTGTGTPIITAWLAWVCLRS